jgi:hypothetical protein
MEITDKIYIAGHRGMVGSSLERKILNSGYSNIIATAADSVLTITGESGIVVGLDPTTNKIVIGNMYVGAQDITLDYGTLDYFTDAIRYDYGFVS